jgi:hypothetical protein
LLLMRERGSEKHGMLDGILDRPSVVKAVYEYVDSADVAASLKERIIAPLEQVLKGIRRGTK